PGAPGPGAQSAAGGGHGRRWRLRGGRPGEPGEPPWRGDRPRADELLVDPARADPRPAHERARRRLRLRRGHSPQQHGALAVIENSSPVRAQAERGKAASRAVALLSDEAKNAALGAMAAALRAETASILDANADDV